MLLRTLPDRKRLRVSALRLVRQPPDVPNSAMMAGRACSAQDWEMTEPLFVPLQPLEASSYPPFPKYKACRGYVHSSPIPRG